MPQNASSPLAMSAPESAAVASHDPAEPETPLTPFVKVPRNPTASMVERAAMLAQPDEIYRPLFGGRLPTLAEKVQFVEAAIQRMTSAHIYENNLYHVEIEYGRPFIHLDIRRHDGGPCKSWRHFQQIKNELIGPEHEAVELFPAESRLVDTSNEYHMWVLADPQARFQFGFGRRWVLDRAMEIQSSSVPASPGRMNSSSERIGAL